MYLKVQVKHYSLTQHLLLCYQESIKLTTYDIKITLLKVTEQLDSREMCSVCVCMCMCVCRFVCVGVCVCVGICVGVCAGVCV